MADSFEQLMQSAQQQLVRMPDGTYRVAPTYSGSTTVPEMYGNTMPAAQNPLPRMDSAGPGPGPSGGYSFLQDMLDASTPSQTRVAALPSAKGTISTNKDQSRQPQGSVLAFAGDTGRAPAPALKAITAATLPTVPLPKWGPSWGVGINSMMPWESSPAGDAPEGDPWATDRFGEPVRPLPGYATGNRAPAAAKRSTGGLLDMVIGALGGGAPSATARPIVQVAPTPFAPDSPGGQFEKQNGQGSATNSMLTSSRWQTGY